jgi:hypothetical protein
MNQVRLLFFVNAVVSPSTGSIIAALSWGNPGDVSLRRRYLVRCTAACSFFS